MKDSVIEEIKRLCGKVRVLNNGWCHFVYRHLHYLYIPDESNGMIRISIPHVVNSKEYKKEEVDTAVNETNRKVKFIKAMVLNNGSISLNYDHRISNGENASEIVDTHHQDSLHSFRVSCFKTEIKMKWFVLILSFSLSSLELSAQSDYYERQARSHQSDAAYYVKQAQGYDREVEYYMREAAGHLRDAEYYQRQKQYKQARSSLRKARNAIERADENKRKADNAQSNTKSYMRRAEDAIQNVKKVIVNGYM